MATKLLLIDGHINEESDKIYKTLTKVPKGYYLMALHCSAFSLNHKRLGMSRDKAGILRVYSGERFQQLKLFIQSL